MLPTTYTFQYNPENLHAFSYVFSMDSLAVPLIVLGTIALYGCIYFLAPHIYSFLVNREKKQEKEAKRNVIRDLILMKEVQGELEKEIEQSLLNITLQGKGA
ncbi:MAG: hypothetical protein PHH16_02545 [Candidatus Gracilibacteria bacterium]|nr:hypothetical protein [Candidatus Gracilibacteria bacterium]